jgi:hypothetical protein
VSTAGAMAVAPVKTREDHVHDLAVALLAARWCGRVSHAEWVLRTPGYFQAESQQAYTAARALADCLPSRLYVEAFCAALDAV